MSFSVSKWTREKRQESCMHVEWYCSSSQVHVVDESADFLNAGICTMKISGLRHVLLRDEDLEKEGKNQAFTRHFAHCNMLRSWNLFPIHFFFFSGSIFPGSPFLKVSTRRLYIPFASFQVTWTWKDLFPWPCFSWLWWRSLVVEFPSWLIGNKPD